MNKLVLSDRFKIINEGHLRKGILLVIADGRLFLTAGAERTSVKGTTC